MADREWAPEIKDLGEKIANLKVSQAVELGDYLKEVYKIEPAGGGVMMAAPAGGGGGAAPAAAKEEQTEFTVVLTGFDAAKKINVIKVVRELVSGLGLKEAKDLVESAPKPILEAVPKDAAEAAQKKLQAAGPKVSLA